MDERVRVVVLTEREHGLLLHLLRWLRDRGIVHTNAEHPTMKLIEQLEAAREQPVRPHARGWLERWRSRGA